MNKKFLLIIHGPMCSGKTTIANLFCSLNPGIFQVSFDKIKRFISDYSPGMDYGQILDDIIFSMADKAAENGLSLLFEGNFKLRKELNPVYQQLASKYNLTFVEVNIEAPFEILEDRFLKRIDESEINGNKLFVKTLEGMRERYDTYMVNKNDRIPAFNSNIDSAEIICEKIKSVINDND